MIEGMFVILGVILGIGAAVLVFSLIVYSVLMVYGEIKDTLDDIRRSDDR